MPRYHIALLYEDAMDVAARDQATAQMVVSRAVSEMLDFRFTQSGMSIPRHKDLLNELAMLDSRTAELAHRFFEASSLESRLDLAGEIADRTIGARGFFEWETSPEALSS